MQTSPIVRFWSYLLSACKNHDIKWQHIARLFFIFTLVLQAACTKIELRGSPYDSATSPEAWAPEDLTVEQLSLVEAKLTWTLSDERIDGVVVDRKVGDGTWLIGLDTVPKSAKTYIDTTYVPNPQQAITYRICAIAGKQKSTAVEQKIEPVFPAIAIQLFQKQADGKVFFRWVDHLQGHENYVVERKTTESDWSPIGTSPVAIQQYTDTVAPFNTTVVYRVSAMANGFKGGTVETEVLNTTLGEVKNLVLSAQSATNCTVTWAFSANWCNGVVVERAIDGAPFEKYKTLDAAANMLTDVVSESVKSVVYKIYTIGRGINGTPQTIEFAYGSVEPLKPELVLYNLAFFKSMSASVGAFPVTSCGVCYGTSQNPSITGTKTVTNGVGVITASLTPLLAGTKYYARAYAINARGVSYGQEVEFTTMSNALPTLTATTVSNIAKTSATVSANVSDDGGLDVTERGFVYATTNNPTTANTKLALGTGIGAINTTISGLADGASYYVRAYAINSKGTAYGETMPFTTTAYVMPVLGTTTSSAVSYTTATLSGSVTSAGDLPVAARGFVYATTPNPTLANTKVSSGTGVGSFTANLSALTNGTTYYVRSYVQNSKDIVYGTQIEFTTPAYGFATVGACTTSNLSYTYVTVASTISADGGQTVTERGFVYATTTNPTTANSKVVVGNGTGSFNTNLTNLSDGQTYYLRAYAVNGKGVSYGSEKVFTTQKYMLPTVSAVTVSDITYSSANLSASISADGGQTVTERGFVYGTTANPTIANSKVVVGNGTGSFNTNLTNLSDGQTYFVRAYAVNGKGVSYGVEKVFATQKYMLPTVSAVTVSDITYSTANLSASISTDGGQAVTERGFVYGISANPTIADDKIIVSSGIGSFNGELKSLKPSTLYYIRAFASNSEGTAYGTQVSFTTTEGFTETVASVSFDMIGVEGGIFDMGSNDGYVEDVKPVHRVTISSFSIGKTEVTQALWQAVMGNNPSYFKGNNLPVEQLGLVDCQAFIVKLNQLTGKTYRLPTEAEWEFAARGGSKSKSFVYAGSNKIDDVAWHIGNSDGKTQSVGSKQPNELGLYDMSGNVLEWCQDQYAPYTSQSQTDPVGTTGQFKVTRGGSWNSYWTNCIVVCRSETRSIEGKGSILGFRLVLSK